MMILPDNEIPVVQLLKNRITDTLNIVDESQNPMLGESVYTTVMSL